MANYVRMYVCQRQVIMHMNAVFDVPLKKSSLSRISLRFKFEFFSPVTLTYPQSFHNSLATLSLGSITKNLLPINIGLWISCIISFSDHCRNIIILLGHVFFIPVFNYQQRVLALPAVLSILGYLRSDLQNDKYGSKLLRRFFVQSHSLRAVRIV